MSSREYLEKVTIGSVTELNCHISLQEYDSHWVRLYLEEKQKIETALKGKNIVIEHAGSTSVPGLCAKPIIDILLLVENSADEMEYAEELERQGYVLRIREPEWFEHRMFKGQHPEVNLHVFSLGCEETERMLSFRNWLRTHEEDRNLYTSEKRRLANKTWKYVQEYADAKSEVVREILRHTDR